MRRLNAAAFAPEALRRASPKLGKNHAERRRELAERAESIGIFFAAASAVSALNVIRSQSPKPLRCTKTSCAARPVSRVATGRTSKRGLADRRGGVRPSRHQLPPDRRPFRRQPPLASTRSSQNELTGLGAR